MIPYQRLFWTITFSGLTIKFRFVHQLLHINIKNAKIFICLLRTII